MCPSTLETTDLISLALSAGATTSADVQFVVKNVDETRTTSMSKSSAGGANPLWTENEIDLFALTRPGQERVAELHAQDPTLRERLDAAWRARRRNRALAMLTEEHHHQHVLAPDVPRAGAVPCAGDPLGAGEPLGAGAPSGAPARADGLSNARPRRVEATLLGLPEEMLVHILALASADRIVRLRGALTACARLSAFVRARADHLRPDPTIGHHSAVVSGRLNCELDIVRTFLKFVRSFIGEPYTMPVYPTLRNLHTGCYRILCGLVGVPTATSVAAPVPPAGWPAERTCAILDEEPGGRYLVAMCGEGQVRVVGLGAFARVVAPPCGDDAFDRHRPRPMPYGARASAYTIKNALQDGFMRAGPLRASVSYAYALLRAEAADPAVGPSASSPRQDEAIVHMPRGVLVEEQNLYRSLLGHIQRDPARWDRPVHAVFCQEYAPQDPDETRGVLREFADEHGFELEDRTAKLGHVRTVRDVLKLYQVLVQLATMRPGTLFFVVPDVHMPTSLSVVEGLYALRLSMLAGDLDVFLRNAPKTELTRTRRYDLVAFQSDNIVLAANQSRSELSRSLADLVGECPVCLEPFTDASCGPIVYPFRCRHALHHPCFKQAYKATDACPTCREVRAVKSLLLAEAADPAVGPSASSPRQDEAIVHMPRGAPRGVAEEPPQTGLLTKELVALCISRGATRRADIVEMARRLLPSRKLNSYLGGQYAIQEGLWTKATSGEYALTPTGGTRVRAIELARGRAFCAQADAAWARVRQQEQQAAPPEVLEAVEVVADDVLARARAALEVERGPTGLMRWERFRALRDELEAARGTDDPKALEAILREATRRAAAEVPASARETALAEAIWRLEGFRADADAAEVALERLLAE